MNYTDLANFLGGLFNFKLTLSKEKMESLINRLSETGVLLNDPKEHADKLPSRINFDLKGGNLPPLACLGKKDDNIMLFYRVEPSGHIETVNLNSFFAENADKLEHMNDAELKSYIINKIEQEHEVTVHSRVSIKEAIGAMEDIEATNQSPRTITSATLEENQSSSGPAALK